jgi:hypothetical protein
MSLIVSELCSDYWFPSDTTTERLLLSAMIVALPVDRKSMVVQVRESWFFEDWHREVYRSLSKYRDFDGEELLKRLLTRQLRDKWPESFRFLRELLINTAGVSICGVVRDARRYIADLKKVYERRTRLVMAAGQLEDAVNECRDSIFVS